MDNTQLKNGIRLEDSQRFEDVGYYIYDLQTEQWESSEETDRIFGVSSDFPRTREAWMGLIYPEDQAATFEHFHQLDASFKEVDLQFRIVQPITNKIVWIHCHGQRIQMGKGFRLVGTVKDITAQVISEDSLKDAEQQYSKLSQQLEQQQSLLKQLIDSTPDLIFYKNSDSVYIGCNRAFEAFCGRSENELLGATDFDMFPKDTAELFRTMDQIMLSKKISHQNNEWVQYPDGRSVFLETLKTPFMDSAGNTLGLIGISRDITHRRLQELELEAAKVDAEKANAAKGEFLAMISHDIRTPLNAIMGLSNYLSTMLSDEDLKFCAQTIHSAGENMLSLINDLLDLSKIDSGMMEIIPDFVAFQPMVQKTLQLFSADAKAKEVELGLTFDSHFPQYVYLDENRFRQILVNLVGNAMKFTDDGSITITISCTPTSETTANIHLSVEDTGVGLAPNALNNLFEPFVQDGAGVTRGGTGLGLSITRKLLYLMGGTITAENRPSGGSRFSVILKDTPISNSIDLEGTVPAIPGTDILFKEATLLIADDSETHRETYRRILSGKGLQILFVNSGFECVQTALEKKPHLIIIDYRVPIMSGSEVVSIVKNHVDTQSIPVILSSSCSTDLQNYSDCGFDDVLEKPLTIHRVLKALKNFLPLQA